MKPVKTCFFLIVFLINSAVVFAEGTDSLNVRYLVRPEYPGCLDSFILNRYRYPESARENGIEGRVGVCFIVTETGEITNIQCIRSSGNNFLDREAMRIITLMPRWQFGTYKKQPIRMMYALPITFHLD